MGHTAGATCDCCGYQADYVVGGGMANFSTVAMFPVSCSACQELSFANFKQPPLRCKRCGTADVIPFTAPGMSKGDGKNDAERWESLTLDDGHYRRPKCGQFGLQFDKRLGMMFD